MNFTKIWDSELNAFGRIAIIILGSVALYFVSHGFFYPLWMKEATPLFWQIICGAILSCFVGAACFVAWALLSAIAGVFAWGITGEFLEPFETVFYFPVWAGLFLLKFFFGDWDRFWWRKK